VAFLRGRKLHGNIVTLPEQCRGLVVKKDETSPTDQPLEGQGPHGDGQIQAAATFTSMVLWGHETAAEASADPHLRSLHEWLDIATKASLHQEGKGGGVRDVC
jgi:ribonuclease H2 subunit C